MAVGCGADKERALLHRPKSGPVTTTTDHEVETLIGQRQHVAGDLMIASAIGINYKEPAANSRRLLLVRLGRSWILSVLPAAEVGEKAGQAQREDHEDREDAVEAGFRDGECASIIAVRRTTVNSSREKQSTVGTGVTRASDIADGTV